jgi:prolipoprotein diacylglyceryltransferase
MIMALICRFPCWPIKPIFGLLAIAGIIFSIVMIIDCLKRPAPKFYCPITKEAEYDKLIWAAGILLSLQFYFVGAIVYFFVVKRAKPDTS